MRKSIAIIGISIVAVLSFNLIIPQAGCACIDAAVYADGTVVWLKDETTVNPDGTIRFKDGHTIKPGFWERLYYRNYLKRPKVTMPGELRDKSKSK
ncbi:hypothetical protein XM38_011910 [Halomicronema hongdechloris C2206]|uniref:Uncharacterized protein n=1 Tax=Halomicronema hongdechloris C2206 TaxID=1641165 RepID=A0A1Z3HIY7_9CYAN|nr:hypothetical protein [Halomicronema hongdechloris]ASC70255.1 hypothetical protein XM38_011910 [Halomicronema hongdechloris C2206]